MFFRTGPPAIAVGLFIPFGLVQKIYASILKRPYIRAVNYHDIPFKSRKTFEAHLRWFKRYFSGVTYDELEGFLKEGIWKKEKPGLIIFFDDGLRTHYDTAMPLLDKYGFTGWFAVPSDFIGQPVSAQTEYAESHRIDYDQTYEDGRIALGVEELNYLKKRHVIVCHTASHKRLPSSLNKDALYNEIVLAKERLQSMIKSWIKVFCWVGGEERNYSKEAANAVKNAGFNLSFNTKPAVIVSKTDPHLLGRTSIKSHWGISLIKFHLLGILDIFYIPQKRRIYKTLLGGAGVGKTSR